MTNSTAVIPPPTFHVYIPEAIKKSEKTRDGDTRYFQEAFLNSGEKDPLYGNPVLLNFRIPLNPDDQPHQAGYYLFEHPCCMFQVNQYGAIEAKRIYAGTPFPIVFLSPAVGSAVQDDTAAKLAQEQKEKEEKARLEAAKNAAGVTNQHNQKAA